MAKQNIFKSLESAYRKGYQRKFELLLNKCDPNVDVFHCDRPMNALHMACKAGFTKVVERLLRRKGANIYLVAAGRNEGKTALHFAADKGCEKIVQLILKKGAFFNSFDGDGRTALHIACERGFTEIAEQILRRGADVDLTAAGHNKNRTALHFAAKKGCSETVNLLLSRGASACSMDQEGMSALHMACSSGSTKTVEILLNHGTDVNLLVSCSTDNEVFFRRTALHFAAEKGCMETIELLLRRGALVDLLDKDGLTALHIACLAGFSEIAEILLSHGSKVNLCSYFNGFYAGQRALHFATHSGSEETIRLLLSRGANVNALDGNQFSALHVSSNLNYLEIAELLLIHGAEVDAPFFTRMDEGFRPSKPLHLAKTPDMVDLLLEYGASINATSMSYLSPLIFVTVSKFHLTSSTDRRRNLDVIYAFLKHFVKMRAQGIYLDEVNLRCLRNGTMLSFVECCENEIRSMRDEMISGSKVSYFDFLVTKHESILSDYLINKNVTRALQVECYKEDFPIYASLIGRQFSKGKKIRELVQSSSESLYLILNKVQNLPYVCAEKINKYLSKRDMSNVIQAKPDVSDVKMASTSPSTVKRKRNKKQSRFQGRKKRK